MQDHEVILRATHLRTKETCYLKLEEGKTWMVGRSCATDDGASWTVPFDPALSRRHFRATLRAGRLWVEAGENRHPISVAGETKQTFSVGSGETFLTAHTVFELEQVESKSDLTYSVKFNELLDSGGGQAQRCLSALLELQPILSSWRLPRDFFKDLIGLLKTLVPQATSFQVYQGQEWTIALTQLGQPLVASRPLLLTASTTGESQFQLWDSQDAQISQTTMLTGTNWALACPIDNKADRYILYVVGIQDQNSGSILTGDQDRNLITLIAKQVNQYFSSCRTAQSQAELAAERRQRLLSDRLRSLSHGLSESLSLENTGLRLLDALHEAVSCANSALLILDHQTAYPVITRPAETGFDSYWSSVALEQLQRLIRPSVAAVPLSQIAWQTLFPQANASHQGLLLPLFSQGQLLALIAISRLNELTQADIDLLVLLSSQATAAVQNASLRRQLEFTSITDEVTGLHHRRHFYQLSNRHWKQLQPGTDSSAQPLWALVLGLDHFKDVNQNYGDELGDKMLKYVAATCKAIIPGHEFVSFARWDGDRLAALSLAPLNTIAEEMRLKLESTPLQIGESAYPIKASFGVAHQTACDCNVQHLLNRAESRLQQAKHDGRNRVVSEDPQWVQT